MNEVQFAGSVFSSLAGGGATCAPFRSLIQTFNNLDDGARVRILLRFLHFGQAEFEFSLRMACVQKVISHFSMFCCFYLGASVDEAIAQKRRCAWKLLAIRLQGTPGVSWLLVNHYSVGYEHAGLFISCMVMYFSGELKFALLSELGKHGTLVAGWNQHCTLPRTTAFILLYMWQNECCKEVADAALINMLSEVDTEEAVVNMIADVFLRKRDALEEGSSARCAIDSVPDAFREQLDA